MRNDAGWPISTKSTMRASVLVACSRCSRPRRTAATFPSTRSASPIRAYQAPEDRNLSLPAFGWRARFVALPVPALPVLRSGGSLLFDMRPWGTNARGTLSIKASAITRRCSVPRSESALFALGRMHVQLQQQLHGYGRTHRQYVGTNPEYLLLAKSRFALLNECGDTARSCVNLIDGLSLLSLSQPTSVAIATNAKILEYRSI